MNLAVTTNINTELCIGCGACVESCPSRTLSMVDGKARVTGSDCLVCDHCAAICPVSAVTVEALSESTLRLSTLADEDIRFLRPGSYDTASLVSLMRSRRSCRRYTEKPVARDVLTDLVKIGTTAPSGTNNQFWTFTVLPDRPAVESLGKRLMGFYKNLNNLSEKSLARLWAKLFMHDALGLYYRNYHDKVAEAIAEYEAGGRDRMFHGAPAVILIGSKPGASCPAEDALLATQNILLAAHAMGLGTCLIGFAVQALHRDPSIGQSLGLPAGERIHAVIALGYGAEVYHRLTGRKEPTIRILGR